MSRMGNKPITADKAVKMEMDGQVVKVTGPKGTLSITIPEGISIEQNENTIHVKRANDGRQMKMNHGLVRSLLNSMFVGVTTGFKVDLELVGVGYRGQIKGQELTLNLGYSIPIVYNLPKEVKCTMADQNHITLESIDKQLVGQVAANIRSFRVPDAYHGKGVRYAGEQIVLKEGKKVGK